MSDNYHAMGYAKHVLFALAVHGGQCAAAKLGAVNLIYVDTLVDRGLAVRDGDVYTLTAKGWEWFRDGTGYRSDWYGPGLVKGQPVTA